MDPSSGVRPDIQGPAIPPARSTTGAIRASAALLALSLLALTACGGGGDPAGSSTPGSRNGSSAPALSAFQLEHGIGPITTELTLGALDPEMANRGKGIYQLNCEACHQLQDRFVGPPLGRVLEHRTPTYVMNMILNPERMVREHPEGKKLLAEYLLVMPYQNVSEDEARAIVEYFRTLKEQ